MFKSGLDCIEYIKTNNPVLILTYINEREDIDVYIVSAYSTTEYVKRAKSLGASGHFTKPV